MLNYYQTLEVEPKASFGQIKAAYRKKALQCHPDRGGSHVEMVQINEAWEILSNQTLRQQYDEMLRTGQSKPEQFEAARNRSKNYERDWSKFDSWLSSIGKDFTSARYGSKTFLGMELPTASDSVSAWIFLIAGGLAGLLICGVFVTSVYIPNLSADNRNSPFLYRVLSLFCLGSVAIGAWCGKWTHERFGASIAYLLPKESPFSFFKSETPALASSHEEPGNSLRKPTGDIRNVTCPECKQKLRVPKATKTLSITCPKCQTKFDFQNQNNQQERNKMKFPPDKTSLATLLRCLLIFEIVFAVILTGVGMLLISMGDQALADAGLVSSEPNMFLFAMLMVALVVLLPLGIASWAGLFQHKNWGRWLYLIALIASHLLSVFTGCFSWTYSWELVSALNSIAQLNSGVILAICFLSPLASEFEASSSKISS